MEFQLFHLLCPNVSEISRHSVLEFSFPLSKQRVGGGSTRRYFLSIMISLRFMLPMLQAAVSLLELYADAPEVAGTILELFSLVAENYTIFLNEVGQP